MKTGHKQILDENVLARTVADYIRDHPGLTEVGIRGVLRITQSQLNSSLLAASPHYPIFSEKLPGDLKRWYSLHEPVVPDKQSEDNIEVEEETDGTEAE